MERAHEAAEDIGAAQSRQLEGERLGTTDIHLELHGVERAP
jgi:hypothetical protein